MAKYKAAQISVTTVGTEIESSDFDILHWGVYPVDGDITVELYVDGAYGDAIKGYQQVPMSDTLGCQKIRIKAVLGTVAVGYYIRGGK